MQSTVVAQVETEYLYLVGDIVDGWKLKANWYWPDSHNDVVQKVLQLVNAFPMVTPCKM